MDISTKKQVEWGVYCENFVMIGLTVDADHFKNRAAIPLAPCIQAVVYLGGFFAKLGHFAGFFLSVITP